ncbi:mobilome CxxCx(11)CxxC protein [Vibrio parahaemolyticus]|uniref:mobilome CxxCx(11)CxxC protein n=1 Tax=Vibrio parahaemolyticus TaxID=670 RepID=UPI00044BB4D6|nr:mobilome CxxCx(11)CxxC protein [Vibrio parahaemolyticus]EGQ7830880.1 hypothetical protein [Vibrio parahaemolyticus]EGQ9828818.1 hypothetical protein [Vibrio parahaemolyticus]EGR0257692.1 hypothetical protein [Vibrio parahaemolyticus]EHH1256182.1 hypothetical protein [Vibrio parahaemolyticus]EHR6658986.1 hypothetical protein [Vibrio parahaemolyticus]
MDYNQETNEERLDKLQTVAHYEFLSYGTAQIFEARANRLKTLRAWITFLGIVFPVVVGGAYTSFGQNSDLMSGILIIAGIMGIVQMILSTWSLVSGWDLQYESAINSLQANTTNFNRCKRFGKTVFKSDAEFLTAFEAISNAVEQQELVDITQHISVKEKHYAHQSALSYYNRACVVCETNPNEANMNQECPSCGQLGTKKCQPTE